MKHLTMVDLEKMGFELRRSYPHGVYVTHVNRKGCITVETTYNLDEDGKFESQELQIDDGKWRTFKPEHLAVLDKILNNEQ